MLWNFIRTFGQLRFSLNFFTYYFAVPAVFRKCPCCFAARYKLRMALAHLAPFKGLQQAALTLKAREYLKILSQVPLHRLFNNFHSQRQKSGQILVTFPFLLFLFPQSFGSRDIIYFSLPWIYFLFVLIPLSNC